MLDEVTGLILFCRTPHLIDLSLISFRRYYPEIKIIVVDNSGKDKSCTNQLERCCDADGNMELYVLPENLGHGIGLHYGIKEVKTKYTYIFESDVETKKRGIIEAMLDLMTNSVYCVSETDLVTYKEGKWWDPKAGIRMMRRPWIYVALLNNKKYFEFPAFNSDNGTNAAPLKSACQAIDNSGKADELLVHFDPSPYIKHHYGGTRNRIGIPSLKEHNKWTSHYSKST